MRRVLTGGAQTQNARHANAAEPDPRPLPKQPGKHREVPPPSRPDASMSLLTDVMSTALDPGYLEAAAYRGRRPQRRATRVVTVLLCAALAASCIWAIQQLRAPQPSSVRAEMERQVEARAGVVAEQQQANAAVRQQIARWQERNLERSGAGELAAQVSRLATVAGEVPVAGPGLELVVRDAPSVKGAEGDPREQVSEEGRVKDRDLQIVVNGLWASGAEAIAVNGQRLTSLSAIRSAGPAILVDFRPLVPPYTVQAIGDAAQIRAGFAQDVAGPYVQRLREDFSIETTFAVVERLELPGAGEMSLHRARALDSPPSAPDTSTEVSP